MEEEEEATFEAEKAAKEGGEEKQAEGGVEEEGEEKMEERVEGEEKKEAGEVKEEEGEVKEEEGEEGGEKKKDGEEGGETERERETEEVQSKGGGLPVEEEAVYEGLEGGGEEEAKAKRIVHVDMVGDATADAIPTTCSVLTSRMLLPGARGWGSYCGGNQGSCYAADKACPPMPPPIQPICLCHRYRLSLYAGATARRY
eukprot:2225318-Rhodomonas_salina.1